MDISLLHLQATQIISHREAIIARDVNLCCSIYFHENIRQQLGITYLVIRVCLCLHHEMSVHLASTYAHA